MDRRRFSAADIWRKNSKGNERKLSGRKLSEPKLSKERKLSGRKLSERKLSVRKTSKARKISRKRHEDHVKELVSKFAKDCGFDLAESQLVDLVGAVKEYAKRDQAGGLFIERELGKKTSVTVNMSRRTSLATDKVKQEKRKQSLSSRSWMTTQKLLTNSQLTLCFIFYIIFNFAFMGYKFYQYFDHGPIMIFGRVCAASLYINITLSSFCILRRTISILRKTFLVNFLPFDDHIMIHKFLGKMIFILSLGHTAAHIARYIKSDNMLLWECLLTTRMKEGWVLHLAGVTGTILFILLCVLIVFSLPFFRRNGYFELFYWVHHISIVWWFVMIFHAPSFWMWFLIPAMLYVWEFISRAGVICRRQDKLLAIDDYELLPSKVTQLKIRRPESFNFSPGDYVFIKIPSIAKHEWHPFTISSAPEENGYFTLHIRSLGNWTAKLHTLLTFIDYCHLVSEQPTLKDFRVFEYTRGNDVQELQDFMSLQRTMSNADETTELACIQEEDQTSSDSPKQHNKQQLGIVNLAIEEVDEPEDQQLEEDQDQQQQRTRKERARLSTYDPNDFIISIDVPLPPAPRKGTVLELRGLPNPDISKTRNVINGEVDEPEDQELEADQDQQQQRTRKERARLSTYDPNDFIISIDVPPPPAPRKGTVLELRGLPNPDISKIYIDGPYGSPSSDIFNAKHAILIAAGIGVTPFASILQSIMHRYRKSKSCCPECRHQWVRDLPAFLKLKKVDFIWINRDVKAFEWFLSILSALEEEQHGANNNDTSFLDFHLFVKGVFAQKGNEQAAGLKVALDLSFEKYNVDILTGLKTKLHTGAPDWDKLFEPYKSHPFGKPEVFFCGPRALGKVVMKTAFSYKFDFKKENF